MLQRKYTVRFTTPAFLGNAEQEGQWRTPPFKHLLREWWRVAWAEEHGYPADVSKMRAEEARLFGSAADGASNKSLLRIRLDKWDRGTKSKWPSTATVKHPEVKGGMAVDSALYLGYGPVKKAGELNHAPAIDAGEMVTLRLAFPDDDNARLLMRALEMMSWFGAIGGRSRNGWGSFMLLGEESVEPEIKTRDWKECLEYEWAHAIGGDEQGPLMWWTESFGRWEDVIAYLAELKIALRTSFPFTTGKDAAKPEARHWLSYPVSNSHSVKGWGNKRLPNSLRFKVRKDESGKLYGVIFHMPCKPPSDFRPDRATLIRVWSSVHKFLDAEGGLQRGR